MPQNVTYTDASRKFQALAGLETLTASDNFFLVNSFNRAALNAYHESNLWPRFLRVGEERSLSSEPISNVTYTYPTEIQLSDYPIVTGQSKVMYSGSAGNILNGVYTLGNNINSMPAWYIGSNEYNSSNLVIALGADTEWYGLYTRNVLGLSANPLFFFNKDNDNIILPGVFFSQTGVTVFDSLTVTSESYSPVNNLSQYFDFSYDGGSSSESIVLASNVAPYTELNKDEIGEFIRIHKERPYGVSSAKEYEFYVDSNGANIVDISSGTTSAFITYKKSYNPSFTEESTDIPQEFLDYMLYCALSDFYTGDGQTENAAIAMNRATMSLDSELFRLEQKNNMNIMGIRFSTHLNHQHR